MQPEDNTSTLARRCDEWIAATITTTTKQAHHKYTIRQYITDINTDRKRLKKIKRSWQRSEADLQYRDHWHNALARWCCISCQTGMHPPWQAPSSPRRVLFASFSAPRFTTAPKHRSSKSGKFSETWNPTITSDQRVQGNKKINKNWQELWIKWKLVVDQIKWRLLWGIRNENEDQKIENGYLKKLKDEWALWLEDWSVPSQAPCWPSWAFISSRMARIAITRITCPINCMYEKDLSFLGKRRSAATIAKAQITQ